jgi:TetR/AcrR family transcriptional regulator, ethionamide resistance regulator
MFDTVSNRCVPSPPMASLTRRTEAQTEKRAAIEAAVLEATEGLLAGGRSYADLKIEDIAGAAGISRTAFYFYFRDKRELLMRLTEEVADVLYAEADAWWSGGGDGREDLERALAIVIALYREHGVLLRAVVEASAYDEAVAGFWRALVGRFVEASRRRIEAEQARGAMTGVAAEATAFALTWMTERACYQRLAQGGDLTDDFQSGLAHIWVAALYGR